MLRTAAAIAGAARRSPGSRQRPAAVLRTVAAVAARATARAAVRYGQLRILESITGGWTLARILVKATRTAPELPEEMAAAAAARLECESFVLTVVVGSAAISALCMAAGFMAGDADHACRDTTSRANLGVCPARDHEAIAPSEGPFQVMCKSAGLTSLGVQIHYQHIQHARR